MILTCPECASRYFIDDRVIGPTGRTVRCQSCGHAWRERPPEEPIELTASPDEGAIGLPPRAEEPAAPSPAPLSDLPADRLTGAFRAKAEEKRRVREAAATGAVWAGLAAVLVVAAAAALVFRTDVVQMLPRTATAYAAIGLPVNTTGITIEKVEAQPGLQDGRAAVIVTGALRNIEKRPVSAPALRINLLNASGKTVQGKIAAPGDAKIPAGETRHFTITLLDPPSTATDVEVVFQEAKPPPPPPRRPAAGSSAPMPALRAGAAPPRATDIEEAKPIEGNAPFALPEAAAGPAAREPHD